MCDYSRKPVKWQVGNFSHIYVPHIFIASLKQLFFTLIWTSALANDHLDCALH